MGKLDITNLTKVFGEDDNEIIAVDDLDIAVNDGEFLVLVGPSGCGKSTTLRCIAGLETVTDGKISIDGREVTGEKPKDRDIAMVFQNYALYPHMTVRENMEFGLRMTTDLPDSEVTQRIEETAAMMGIEPLLEDHPGELSGGQQQRVALGRAIVREPAVFLMDEPLSNLDAKLRTTMRTELQELQQDLDATTIYVTHDQTEAMTMGDRIAILNEGELQQIGTPLECYHSPTNQFVAGFIGSPAMNFFDVELTDGALVHEAFEYDISPEMAERLTASETDKLSLGIRPEDIRSAEPDSANSISITVNVTEPLGDATFIYFDLGQTECTASVPGHVTAREDSTLSIVFPEECIHVFDRETGEALENREMPSDEQSQWSVSV